MDANGYKNIDISSEAQNWSFKEELLHSPIYIIRELACIDKRHVFFACTNKIEVYFESTYLGWTEKLEKYGIWTPLNYESHFQQHIIYRMMRAETDMITIITSSLIRPAVILVIMDVETFKTAVFISNVTMCLTLH